MHTPFFPAFRSRLAPLGKRVHILRQHSLLQLDQLFGRWLPPDLLAQADDGPNSRDRIFNVRRTFFGFLYQVLNPGYACRQVVQQIQALFALHQKGPVDGATGAWCQARARLPWAILPRLRAAIAARARRAVQPWFGLVVKVIDGTTASLPDTVKNQRTYPQSTSQRPGCGFPLLKLVGVFCLATGVLLDYAKGNKHRHELNLFQGLRAHFKAGDLALADRGLSSYSLLALLVQQAAHCLFRLHQARPTDLRRGKRLGKHDRLMVWRKPIQRPGYLPKALWKNIPAELTVRVLRFKLPIPGFRPQSVTLVTTLLDPRKYPAAELAALYVRRWRIELWFRDIKTSMGMEVLRCKSPKMVHKELEMFFIAYNWIRALMVEAALHHDKPLERLSFKGTVDAVREFSIAIAQASSRKKQHRLIQSLLQSIAADIVPDRPGRRQPRAVKRRPKPFPLLNRHRHKFKEIPHRSRWRRKTSNSRTVI